MSRYPFDYVLGSVHHIDGWGFDDPRVMHEWDRRDVDEVYRRYFQLVGDSAEAGVFTILGHVDLVKKFGHRPEDPAFDAVVDMADRIARAGTLVEINTAGLRRPVGEIYPHLSILRRSCGPTGWQSPSARTPTRPRKWAVTSIAAPLWRSRPASSEYAALVPDDSHGRAASTCGRYLSPRGRRAETHGDGEVG